jgi:hypothetical protein
MPNDETPTSARWRRRRRALCLLALVAGAVFSVGLDAPVSALAPVPYTDTWESVDTGLWIPPTADDVTPAPPSQDPPADQGIAPEPPPIADEPLPPDDTVAPAVPVSPADGGGATELPQLADAPTGMAPPEVPVEVPDEQAPQQEVSDEQAAAETKKAVDEALRLLKEFPECEKLIGGEQPAVGPPVYASNVLEILRKDDKIADLPGLSSSAWAQAPVGKGAGGVLMLFKEFHTEPPKKNATDLYKSFGDGSKYRPMVDYMFTSLGGTITPEELRAFIVLHELAHLMGTLPAERDPMTLQVLDQVKVWEFNSSIFTNCTRAIQARKLFQSPPSRGHGPWVGEEEAPLPEPDPLPESELPVVDFGSDCPVIRDEAGNVIDGGDCGDPGESELPVLGDCCDEVVPDPGDSELPELGDCCDEVFPDDPGEPFDPGFGGGDDPSIDPSIEPGYYSDAWWCCNGGGGGGGDGGYDHYYDDDYYWVAEEEYAA